MTPAEAAAGQSRQARVTLQIEHIQGPWVSGWMLDRADPGRESLSLEQRHRRWSLLALRRVARPDVSEATGQPPELPLGFEGELPLDAWQALLAGEALEWHLGDLRRPWLVGERPDAAEGRAWAVQRLWLAAPEERSAAEARWRTLAAAPVDEALLGAALRRLEPRPMGLDGLLGLRMVGWVADLPSRRSAIVLKVDDQPWPAALRRCGRKDVAQQLGWTPEGIGFELELPGSIWQPKGLSQRQLQVWVDGSPLGAPVTLAASSLPDLFAASRQRTDARQRQEDGLLAIEHLRAAGQWEALSPGALRQAQALLADAGLGPQQDLPEPLAPVQPGSPRGRLGRWLNTPQGAALAWRLLSMLRRRPATRARAQALEFTLTRALGLFDRAFYERQMPAARRGGRSGLRHYVEEGDACSLSPHRLFDPRHYVGQLPGRRHPGVNRLLHYGLVGRFQGLSISAWFDTGHYLRHSPDVAASGIDPLRHFCTWGWQEARVFLPGQGEAHAVALPLRQRLDLAAAQDRLDPMCAALLARVPPGVPMPEQGRLPWEVPTEIEGHDHLDPAPWAALAAARPRASAGEPIDVIVPVYAGSQESLRCLWAVLTAPVRRPYHLVVVDDASPEPALSAMLARLAGLGLLELLVNRDNLGFVRSVNRALALHPGRDVVLLNADTCVHGDWLDRLLAHLDRDPAAASVTPLSNNATIFSYPLMGMPNGAGRGPLRLDAAQADRLLAAQAAPPVQVPSAVGFCMLMRGSALAQVGPLDAERFGRGYGEENDWCLRSAAAGWHHLAAPDVFVWHDGSVSFKGEAESRTRAAVQLLLERYPDYQRSVDDWLRADPLAGVRARLDADRLHEALAGRGLVLMVSHDRGGGTLRHEEEQAMRLRAQGLEVLWMRPADADAAVTLVAPAFGALPNLAALPLRPEAGDDDPLAAVLQRLPLRAVQLHHLADHDEALAPRLLALCTSMRLPLEATVHDYRMLCPRINLVDPGGAFCGDPLDPAVCRRCLAADGLDAEVGDIADWRHRHRQLLAAAQRVIVPDEDVAHRLRRHWPELVPEVVPHEPPITLDRTAWLAPLALRHIAVVGALSPVKGFEVLRRLAASDAARRRGWRFTLLGYSSDDAALVAAGVTVLGRYEDSELPQRLQALSPDLLLVPSIWPETYCYVLSEALASGRPVAAFDIGAQGRRLRALGLDRFLLPLDEALDAEALVQRLERAQS